MKLFKLFVLWLAIIGVYIILANIYPVFTALTGATVIEVQASGNMSKQPGIVGGLQIMPLIVWFIPAVVGVAASVAWLREDRGG